MEVRHVVSSARAWLRRTSAGGGHIAARLHHVVWHRIRGCEKGRGMSGDGRAASDNGGRGEFLNILTKMEALSIEKERRDTTRKASGNGEKSRLKTYIEAERERWERAERDGLELDLFQRWCSWDGYDKAAETLLSLPYPIGYWDRLEHFQKRIFAPSGICLERPLLLSMAFMHQSWVNGARFIPGQRECGNNANPFANSALLHHGNKGLEFLGDAVLKVGSVTSLLGEIRCSKIKELTWSRQQLENNNVLGVLGLTTWAIGPVMLVKEGKLMQPIQDIIRAGGVWQPGMGGFANDSHITREATDSSIVSFSSDCVEAVLGAVAVEKGATVAESFVREVMVDSLREQLESSKLSSVQGDTFNPILEFQMLVQKKMKDVPVYNKTDDNGKVGPHKVEVLVNGEKIAEGEGSNLRAARRNAADKALKTGRFAQ